MTEDIDLIRVTGVEYVKDYTMRLEFSNGKVKLVNFLPLLKGKLFEPLKDLRNLRPVRASPPGRSNGTTGPTSLRITCIGMGWRLKTRPRFASGFVLTNRFTEKSDIDLVVDFDKEVEQVDYVNNFFDLRDALSAIFHREIDLLEDKAIRNPILKKNIDNTKLLIYG